MSKGEEYVGCGFLVIALLLCAGWWVFSSKMEAEAFNRLTNSDATTWEAMWTNLRVDGGARK